MFSVIHAYDEKGYDIVDNLHYFSRYGFDSRIPHDHTVCEGNCSAHPLMRPEYLLSWAEMDAIEQEQIERLATEKLAAMSAKERQQLAKAAALAKEAAELAKKVSAEALVREQYARDVKERAQMGLKRGEKAQKVQQPCKWVIGQFAGDECWAWEYKDPKTGKRECPHTCQRLHPGEEGWHAQWLTSPRYKPEVRQKGW